MESKYSKKKQKKGTRKWKIAAVEGGNVGTVTYAAFSASGTGEKA